MTYLHCPLYDFTVTPDQRRQAIRLADHTASSADPLDSDAVHAALLASGADPGSVDAVLSTLSYGAQAADLAARGTSSAGTLAARGKGECRRILHERGVPSVGFRVVTDAAEAPEAVEAIGYPVIVKAVLGIGKAVTLIPHDPLAVRAHLAAAAADRDGLTESMARQLDERYPVEELVSGDRYSVKVAASGGRLISLVCASRKVNRGEPGTGTGMHRPLRTTCHRQGRTRSLRRRGVPRTRARPRHLPRRGDAHPLRLLACRGQPPRSTGPPPRSSARCPYGTPSK
ncbi:hypothetical protein ACFYVM_09000 [Streptomyces sp. NPDC003280]|uniref:hypothetical protein n=1 Tax=Streptomyces sp. NPDC003280 TaxID=3364680 RepID=UPI00368F3925